MENPLGHASRAQRTGMRTFRRCDLKSVPVYMSSAIGEPGSHYTDKKATVSLLCPTTRYTITPNTSAVGDKDKPEHKIVKEARANLERLCGATVCQDCVYAGMTREDFISDEQQKGEERARRFIEQFPASTEPVEDTPVMIRPKFPPESWN